MSELDTTFLNEMLVWDSKVFRYILTYSGLFSESMGNRISHEDMLLQTGITADEVIDHGLFQITRKPNGYNIKITGNSDMMGFPGDDDSRLHTLEYFRQTFPDFEIALFNLFF
ncbi:MAG TPA: hypothetical protein PLS49_08670 [Candidatus Woesebacteria bacterium]|nr:hypothetical protein [Candidatus Woesebacteria bacterium]